MLQIFGHITPSLPYGGVTEGLTLFLNNIIRLLIVVGGLWTFLNIILAGFDFLGGGNDPKKVNAAWSRIWWSALGLLFIIASFLLAALLGYLLFKDPGAILNPKIYGPQI